MEGRDSLNRRSRFRRTSTGKRISPQPRDLLWFQRLHEHGPLSSTFLHEFSKQIARSEKRAKDRLTDLFNEDSTYHGGPYLDRPPQQFRTLDARYQPLVYDLAPAAERALKEAGLWSDYATRVAGPWWHRSMMSAITASIELATLDNRQVNFIPQHTILERAQTRLRYPVTFAEPKTGKPVTSDLIPDALFGLEYVANGTKSYRFFLLEADRATEPTRASQFNRKSHLKSFLQYREYVGRGLYREHLKLTAPLLVLNVSTSEQVIGRMMKLLGELAPDGCTYQLFQTLPHNAGQQGLSFLFSGSWHRQGSAAIRITAP